MNPISFHADSPRGEGIKTRLEAFSPQSRVLCALLTSLVLSSARSWQALFAGAPAPLLLLFAGNVKPLARTLLKLNFVSVFICVLLPLTYPGTRAIGVFSLEGLDAALLITFKLNLISIVTIQMIGSLGMKLGGVLKSLKFPDKLSVLLILTTRYIFLLTERVAAMTRAVLLRAPRIRGGRLYYSFACMLGTALIHSSDKAERAMLAMECRGGMDGFFQSIPKRWSGYDTLLCVLSALNAAVVLFI